MPVYSKRQLRQSLAQRYIKDMPNFPAQLAGFATGVGTSPITVGNNFFADIGQAGQGLYQNAWLYLEGSTPNGIACSIIYQYAVGSYNAGSGAFISTAVALTDHASVSHWELHTRVSPYDKDAAIDDTIKRIRIRQEVAFPTVDQVLFYPIDGTASPFVIDRVLDVHVFANPSGTLDRDVRHVDDWQIVTTATGNEIRLLHALQGSQQIIFDAILIPSLNGEMATINIPDERWILAGAAARCYDFMIQAAPAQQVAILQQRRQEAAMEFSRLTTRFAPVVTKPVRLNDVVAGRGGQYPDNTSGWW